MLSLTAKIGSIVARMKRDIVCTVPSYFLLSLLVIQISTSIASEISEKSWKENEISHGMPKITNLQVKCGKKYMTVHLYFSGYFNGIIYSKGGYHDEKCAYVRPHSGAKEVKFDIFYDSCGTNSDLHGKYFENTIIIQYQQDIIEAWDEARKIKCEWHDYYEKSAVKPSIKVADLEVVQQDFMGDKIGCWLEIQDGKGPWAKQVSGMVKIGQHMTMVVAITDEYSQFDMRVKSCFAHDGSRYNQPLHLTDDNGCILRPKLMSSFRKIKVDEGRATVISYAYFSAFKFPDKVDVQIECKVEVCRYGCPDHCEKQGYGDRKEKEGYAQNNEHHETSSSGEYSHYPQESISREKIVVQSNSLSKGSKDVVLDHKQTNLGVKIQFESPEGDQHLQIENEYVQPQHEDEIYVKEQVDFKETSEDHPYENGPGNDQSYEDQLLVEEIQPYIEPQEIIPHEQHSNEEFIPEQDIRIPENFHQEGQKHPVPHRDEIPNKPEFQHEPPKVFRSHPKRPHPNRPNRIPERINRPNRKPNHDFRPDNIRPPFRERRPFHKPRPRFPEDRVPKRPPPDFRRPPPNHKPRRPPPNRHQSNRGQKEFNRVPPNERNRVHFQKPGPHQDAHDRRQEAESVAHSFEIPIAIPEPSSEYSQETPVVHHSSDSGDKRPYVKHFKLPEQPPAHYEELPPDQPYAQNRKGGDYPAQSGNRRYADFPKGPRFIHKRSAGDDSGVGQTVLGVTKVFQVISDNDIADSLDEPFFSRLELSKKEHKDLCLPFNGFIAGTVLLLVLVLISVTATAVIYHRLSTKQRKLPSAPKYPERMPMQFYKAPTLVRRAL